MQPEPEESSNLIDTLVADPRDYQGLPLITVRRSDGEILSAHPVTQEAEV